MSEFEKKIVVDESRMWVEKLVVSGRVGSHVRDAMMDAWTLANENKMMVEMDFNGYTVTIKPKR